MPLCEAIRQKNLRATGMNSGGGSNDFAEATAQQVKEVANWLALKIYSDAWEVEALRAKMKVAPVNKGRRADGWQRVDAEGKAIKAEALDESHIQTAKLKDEKGFGEEYAQLITAFSTQARSLFMAKNCHAVNIADVDGMRRLMDELVKLDRLPRDSPLQGLLLLRTCLLYTSPSPRDGLLSRMPSSA